MILWKGDANHVMNGRGHYRACATLESLTQVCPNLGGKPQIPGRADREPFHHWTITAGQPRLCQ